MPDFHSNPSLADLQRNKSRHVREYGQPNASTVSSACAKGKCNQCFMLKCDHGCHRRNLPRGKDMALKLTNTIIKTLPNMPLTVVEHEKVAPPQQVHVEPVQQPEPLKVEEEIPNTEHTAMPVPDKPSNLMTMVPKEHSEHGFIMPTSGATSLQDASTDPTLSHNTPQPSPLPSEGVQCWPAVIEDMQQRHKFGIAKYKVPLTAGDGRFSLVDAYQEELDKIVYLKKEILEQELLKQKMEILLKGLQAASSVMLNVHSLKDHQVYAAGLEAKSIIEELK